MPSPVGFVKDADTPLATPNAEVPSVIVATPAEVTV
jgi:hypothetical protein